MIEHNYVSLVSRLNRLALATILIACFTSDGLAQTRPRRQLKSQLPKLLDGNPPQHVGAYPNFNLIWQNDARVRDVQGVFPHPLLSRRIVLTTGSGLMITDDTGKTWKPLPGTSRAEIGGVRHVEFSINEPNTIFFASATKGVWQITDLIKPPVQIGSQKAGLINDAVSQVRVDTADPTLKTLVAVHGSEAGGISRSQDGGRKWTALPNLEEYFIEKLFPGGPGESWAFALASKGDPFGPRGVYFCLSIGDFFKDYAGDVQASDGALEILFSRPFPEASDIGYWSTASSGLLKTEHEGTNLTRIGPAEIDKWTSVGVTFGATADSRIIYAYEPGQLGLAVSEDAGGSFASYSQGLPSGGFIREGAQVRANAGGSIFFAAINNTLYVGRRYTGQLSISDIDVSPMSIVLAPGAFESELSDFRETLAEFRNQSNAAKTAGGIVDEYRAVKSLASEMVFTVTARVMPGEGSSDDGAPIVTVDLSRAGGAAVTQMFDDGVHGDGAAGDGVYGAKSLIRPDRMRPHYQDKRRPWPGPLGLTITAIAPDGSLSSAVGVIGFLRRAESHTYWTPTVRDQWRSVEGGATVAMDDYQKPGDKQCVKITPKDQPWSVPFLNPYDRNVIGYHALSFYIKTDGSAAKEIYVQLEDSSPDTVSAKTVRVPVLKEGLVEGGTIDPTFRRVVVPFARLLKDPLADGASRFRPTMLQSVIISGDGGAGQNYWISKIRFHATAEELQTPENKPK